MPAFDALLAPFVLGTYDVARAAVTGPAGAALKAELARAGLVALELVPAEQRRVFSVTPLPEPAAFRGLRVRIPDNPTVAAVLRALGAEPVQGITQSSTADERRARRLGAAETTPIWALNSGYGRLAPHITDFALYDRVDTIMAAPSAWKRLSAGERAAIRAAARDTAGYAATLADRDARNLGQLCRGGARVTAISEAQLDAIAEATEPVRAALRRDRAGADPRRARSDAGGGTATAAGQRRLRPSGIAGGGRSRRHHPERHVPGPQAGALTAAAARCPVPVAVHAHVDGAPIPRPVALTAYFLATEALANIAKHAHASSVRLETSIAGDELLVRIVDDGVGGTDPTGSGLRGLRDRITAVDGVLDVTSRAGGGTAVEARIPV